MCRLPPSSFGAISNFAAHRMRFGAGPALIFLGQLVDEFIDAAAMHQVNRGSAKAAASQTRPEAALQASSDFDQRVQFGRAVVEKIARTLMALKHVLTKLPKIALAQ